MITMPEAICANTASVTSPPALGKDMGGRVHACMCIVATILCIVGFEVCAVVSIICSCVHNCMVESLLLFCSKITDNFEALLEHFCQVGKGCVAGRYVYIYILAAYTRRCPANFNSQS